jgi:hypothetical protein
MPYSIRLKQNTGSWAGIRYYDTKAEAEKEFTKLSKPDKQGMVRIMAIFHGRKKIKQNFYD